MARIIQDSIKRPLADELLFGKLAEGGRVDISVRDNKLVLDCHPEPAKAPPEPAAVASCLFSSPHCEEKMPEGEMRGIAA